MSLFSSLAFTQGKHHGPWARAIHLVPSLFFSPTGLSLKRCCTFKPVLVLTSFRNRPCYSFSALKNGLIFCFLYIFAVLIESGFQFSKVYVFILTHWKGRSEREKREEKKAGKGGEKRERRREIKRDKGREGKRTLPFFL